MTLDTSADLDVFFGDFGADLVFGLESAKGNVEHAEVEETSVEGMSVRTRRLTVLVRGDALPSLVIGKKGTVDGVQYVFREALKEDDGLIKRLILTEVAP